MKNTRTLTERRQTERALPSMTASPAYLQARAALESVGALTTEELADLLTTDPLMDYVFYRLVELSNFHIANGYRLRSANAVAAEGAEALVDTLEARLSEIHGIYADLRRETRGMDYKAGFDHLAATGLFREWLLLGNVLTTLHGGEPHPQSFAAYAG